MCSIFSLFVYLVIHAIQALSLIDLLKYVFAKFIIKVKLHISLTSIFDHILSNRKRMHQILSFHNDQSVFFNSVGFLFFRLLTPSGGLLNFFLLCNSTFTGTFFNFLFHQPTMEASGPGPGLVEGGHVYINRYPVCKFFSYVRTALGVITVFGLFQLFKLLC